MIVVTGATGKYGRLVVDGLLRKIPAAKVGVSARDTDKAKDLRALGIRVCRGEYNDPASLREAFDGAEQVLIVSGASLGEEGVAQHRNAIEAAKQAGAKRVLYTSHQGRGESSIFAPTKLSHAPTDALLATCGIPYVSLQNGFYAESALFQLKGLQVTGRIALPKDGPTNWTARADLAEAAVAILLQPNLVNDGMSPPLTGSALLDFQDVARILSELTNYTIERDVVSDDAYRQTLVEWGTPPQYVDLLLSLYTAARAEEFAELDPTLSRLIGKEPTTMRSVLATALESKDISIGAVSISMLPRSRSDV